MNRGLGIIGFLLALVLWATAAVPDRCIVCQKNITERVYLFSSTYSTEKQPVCGACAELETTCSVCRVPVRAGYTKLEDGRLLCQADARICVLTDAALEAIFLDVKRDLFKMLSGHVLPEKNISIQLATRTELDRLTRTQRFPHDKQLTMGLTETFVKKNEFEHRIYILKGLRPSRVAAICAHEYTHAWLHENLTDGRNLDVNTVEGFCELVAFKLMSDRNDAIEKQVILDNAYTSGQIHGLVQAENRYRFYEIVKWIKEGVDQQVDAANTSRVLVRKKDDAPLAVAWQPVKPTAVPDTLVLKGISGTPQRRFALINDTTLEKGEQAKVRVGTSNVVVRCVEISESSVALLINGATEPTELSLRK